MAEEKLNKKNELNEDDLDNVVGGTKTPVSESPLTTKRPDVAIGQDPNTVKVKLEK